MLSFSNPMAHTSFRLKHLNRSFADCFLLFSNYTTATPFQEDAPSVRVPRSFPVVRCPPVRPFGFYFRPSLQRHVFFVRQPDVFRRTFREFLSTRRFIGALSSSTSSVLPCSYGVITPRPHWLVLISADLYSENCAHYIASYVPTFPFVRVPFARVTMSIATGWGVTARAHR